MTESPTSAATSSTDAPFRARTKSFTRRERELSGTQQKAWDDFGSRYVIDLPMGDSHTTIAPDSEVDWVQAFGRVAPLVVEIGCGNGEQAIHAATENPDINLVCFEVWRPGISKLLAEAGEKGIENLRVVEADAQQAMPVLFGEASLDEVWTFFPDPWRKTRHHKRRLVSDSFAIEVARMLRSGGIWRVATDWENYAWQMRDVVDASPYFDNPFRGQNPHPGDPNGKQGGFSPRWEGRVMTHFEQRGLDAGRPAFDVTGIRNMVVVD